MTSGDWLPEWLLPTGTAVVIVGVYLVCFGFWSDNYGYDGKPPSSAIQQIVPTLNICFGYLLVSIGILIRTVKTGFTRLNNSQSEVHRAGLASVENEMKKTAPGGP